MADLIDSQYQDVPDSERLRLSIRYRSIRTDDAIADYLSADTWVGLFLGASPLFADTVYTRRSSALRYPIERGYFSGEDNGCEILKGILWSLQTGKRAVIEDTIEPHFQIVVGPDFLKSDTVNETAPYFDVLVTIQFGGPWHGDAVGNSGPAVQLSVKRADLQQFFSDLLAEALDPCIADETSLGEIRKLFPDRVGAKT